MKILNYFIYFLFFSLIFFLSCSSEKKEKQEYLKLLYKNGNTYCEGTYNLSKNNYKTHVGVWKYFYPNGNLESIIEYYDNGRKKTKSKFYINKQLEYYFEINRDGEIINKKEYFASGVLKYTELKKDDFIISNYFNEKGKLTEEEVTKINKNDATYIDSKLYYENGLLYKHTKYVNDYDFENGQIYDSLGNIIIELKYDDGIINMK